MSTKRNFFGFKKKEKPDLEAEDRKPTLLFYFKLLFRKFGKLLSLNLMMDFMVFPLLAILFIILFGRQTTTVSGAAFAPVYTATVVKGFSGISATSANAAPAASPALAALLSVVGALESASYPTTGAIIAIIALLVFTVFTWGFQNVGSFYNLRSLVRGDSCFLLSDYFYAIKRNWKQGLVYGLIDVAVIGVLCFDIFYYLDPSGFVGNEFFFYAMLFLSVALLVIYAFMRTYIYLMMITFDLPIKKLLKNGLIFSMLGLKRNFLALFGITTVALINFLLILPSLSIGFTLPLILPFFYLLSFAGFTATYAAYPNIKRYMIDGDPTLTPPETPVDDESFEEFEADEATSQEAD